MKTVFVQVKCALGEAYDVASAIVEIDGVSEVYSTSGQYDLLVKCYVPKDIDIGRYVTDRIQRTPGVQDTYTIITCNAFS
jgi:DNA-binding Lrp family transcriptional regulator